MKCPYCGYKTEVGQCFCENCGQHILPLKNDGAEQSPVSDGIPSVEPAEEPNASAPKTPTEQKSRKKRIPYRRMKYLLIAALSAAVLCLILAVAVFLNSSSLRVRLVKAEKNLSTAQSQVSTLESDNLLLTEELDTLKSHNQQLNEQAATLSQQVIDLESSINQNTYDEEAAQRDLEEAKSALLQTESDLMTLEQEHLNTLDTLEETAASLSDAQAALSDAEYELELAKEELALTEEEYLALKESVEELQEKTEFFDNYVVFVISGTREDFYHKYDCPDFPRTSFYAYNTSNARLKGYTPCPVCCD